MAALLSLARIDSLFVRIADNNLNPTQLRVLIHVARNPGTNPTKVAELLKVSRTSITESARLLKSRGLLDRTRPDEDDDRKVSYTITEAGDKLLTALTKP